MTKEQHDRLIKYENIFRTAIEARYIRCMQSGFAADMIAVCHELNIYINTSCPACVLKAAQTLGRLYFDYREPEPPATADKPEQSEQPEKPKSSDNKTINKEKKASQNASKVAQKKKSK